MDGQKLMLVYLQKMWKPYINKVAEELGLTDTSSLLVMDNFRAQTTDSVKGVLEEMNTRVPIIPGSSIP